MFWSPDLDPRIIPVSARPASVDDPDAFDILDQWGPVAILQRKGMAEQILLTRSGQSVRLALVAGTFLNGPVRLAMEFSEWPLLNKRLETARRLAAFREPSFVQRVTSSPAGRDRRLLVLRTLDAMATEYSYRAVATALFGPEYVAREWNGRSDFLKSRTRRLVAHAEHLVDGGYRAAMALGS
ncbi:DUF2285 domain-containing protein [Sphingomonas sp. AP4-R1]|uniref:DNA -binding domain-containing protein n=1 Tax=Sphingomonas sp. AP4-R1 TaxID=2735134 RepID=UPI0014935720|nr:DUF2285 domain-containing protein [Sphingomonas sp. AP4-R1]QJU60275.1 DUF2285 domain-containing protein [Sphingomonas sp. AP4-R1]